MSLLFEEEERFNEHKHHHHVSAMKLWDCFACNSFVGFGGFFFFSNFCYGFADFAQ
jgi:hypothetical protein